MPHIAIDVGLQKELKDSIQKDIDHALPMWETKSKESGGPFFAKSGVRTVFFVDSSTHLYINLNYTQTHMHK